MKGTGFSPYIEKAKVELGFSRRGNALSRKGRSLGG
jgi:hypothetical protein